MFLTLCIPLLCGFASSGSFPKPLSKDEEYQCLSLLKNGSQTEKMLAKNKLILHNLRLVAHISKKYMNQQRDQEELISIGVIGLVKAILSYDNEKSIRLATYASRCIENEILMTLRNLKKTQNDISLYEPIGIDRDGNEIVILDVINSNTADFADEIDFAIQSKKMIRAIQEGLSEREKLVITFRYGLNNQECLTQQEIAEMLGISRSYVSRIEKKALKKLNHILSV